MLSAFFLIWCRNTFVFFPRVCFISCVGSSWASFLILLSSSQVALLNTRESKGKLDTLINLGGACSALWCRVLFLFFSLGVPRVSFCFGGSRGVFTSLDGFGLDTWGSRKKLSARFLWAQSLKWVLRFGGSLSEKNLVV